MKRNVRIAIRDTTDTHVVGFFDNKSGIKYNAANLTQFLKGSCSVLVLTYHSKKMVAQSGQKLAFRFKDKDFWLNINSVKKTGYNIELTAYSLSLEANKEKRGPHKPASAMTIKQYIDYYDPENSFVIGINEVADKSLKLEWSGTDTILARLYSVANGFGAELEFVTELNNDYSLKRHVINIYREGNLGKDKTGMPVRVGEKLKVINYSDNMDDFYTGIRRTGKDGLTIGGLNKKIYDDKGNLLFYSSGDTLYAPQARDKYPSIARKTNDGYIVNEDSGTEYANKEALFGYMLSELKKHCELKVDYEVEGAVDGNIGDKKTLIDAQHFDPPLYVQARISEQTESLLEASDVKTSLSNYVRKSNQIANELLQKVEQLALEATPYTIKLATNNGIIFKNNQGQSTVYPTLKKGNKRVECTWQWLVDNQSFGTSATFEVRAAGMSSKLVLTAIALVDEKEVAREQVTFSNVNDGAKGDPGKSITITKTERQADGVKVTFSDNKSIVVPKGDKGDPADPKELNQLKQEMNQARQGLDDVKADLLREKSESSAKIDQVKQDVGAIRNQQTAYEQSNTQNLARITGQLSDKASKSEVKQTADGIREEISKISVGARNLLPNTDFKKLVDIGKQFTVNGKTHKVKTLDKWYNSYNEGIPNPTTNYHGFFNEEKFNETVFEFNESNGVREWKGMVIFFTNDSRFTVGKYVFSADVNATALGTHLEVGFYYYNKAGVRYFHAGLPKKDVTSVDAWSRISLELKINDDVDFTKEMGFYIYGYPFTTNSILYLKRPKLEKGTLATDWSPAPEDTDEQITAARTTFEKTAEGLKTDMTAVKSYVEDDSKRREQLEQYTRTETARSTEALRKQVSENYVAKSQYSEDVRGITRKFEELRVGGTNLFKGSRNFEKELWDYNPYKNAPISERVDDMAVISADYLWGGLSQLIEVKAGEPYTFSFWALSNQDNDQVNIYISLNDWITKPKAAIDVNSKTIAINKAWSRISFTFKVLSDGFIAPRIERFDANGILKYRGFKLERGAISSDWSPAPKDGEKYAETKLAEYKQTVDGQFAAVKQDVNGKVSQTTFDQRANQITQTVQELNDNVVKKNQIRVNENGIVSTAEKVVNGQTLASTIAQHPEWVEIIAKLLKVKADMIVNGAITADKLNVKKLSALASSLGEISAGLIDLRKHWERTSSEDVWGINRDVTYDTGALLGDFGLLTNGAPTRLQKNDTKPTIMPLVWLNSGELYFANVDSRYDLKQIIVNGVYPFVRTGDAKIRFGKMEDGRDALYIECLLSELYLKANNYTDWKQSEVNSKVRWKVQGSLVLVDFNLQFDRDGDYHLVDIPKQYVPSNKMFPVQAWSLDRNKDRTAQLNVGGDLHIIGAERGISYLGQIIWTY